MLTIFEAPSQHAPCAPTGINNTYAGTWAHILIPTSAMQHRCRWLCLWVATAPAWMCWRWQPHWLQGDITSQCWSHRCLQPQHNYLETDSFSQPCKGTHDHGRHGHGFYSRGACLHTWHSRPWQQGYALLGHRPCRTPCCVPASLACTCALVMNHFSGHSMYCVAHRMTCRLAHAPLRAMAADMGHACCTGYPLTCRSRYCQVRASELCVVPSKHVLTLQLTAGMEGSRHILSGRGKVW